MSSWRGLIVAGGPIYAKNLTEWLSAFLAYAAWPLPPNIVGFLGLWLPWLILLYRALRLRDMRPLTPFALGLGLWALLQACALAWSRSGLSGLVSSRYTEFLGWDLVANATAAVLFFKSRTSSGWSRLASSIAMAVWLSTACGYEVWRSHAIYRPYLESFRVQTLEHEHRLGTFMRTADAGEIEGVSFPRIPYASGEIISTLRDPEVQPFLPAPLRRDLVRDRQPSLLPAVQDGPLTFAAIKTLRSGRWIAATGLAMLLAVFVRINFMRRGSVLLNPEAPIHYARTRPAPNALSFDKQ